MMNQPTFAPPSTTSHVSVIARHDPYPIFQLPASSPSGLTPSDDGWTHPWTPHNLSVSSDYQFDHSLSHRLPPIPPQFFQQQLDVHQTHHMPYNNPYPSATKRRTGGRRPKEEEETHVRLSHEEKLKRDQRRQRNKEAAARCRQRRLNTLVSLQKEVDELNKEKSQCESQVILLRHENEELRQILKSHNCCLAEGTAAKAIKLPPPMQTPSLVKREPDDPVLTQCNNLPRHVTQPQVVHCMSEMSFGDVQRPHSLPLTGLTPTTPAIGISLQTPSRGFPQSYDLLGGSTGLTPTNSSNMIMVSMPSSLDTPVITTAPIMPNSTVPTTLKSL